MTPVILVEKIENNQQTIKTLLWEKFTKNAIAV